MEAALDTVLKELRGNLNDKLRAVIKDELAARTAELDRRERELDARSRELADREEAVERREKASQAKQSCAAVVPKPSTPSDPTDTPTPSRARSSSNTAVSALFRPPGCTESAIGGETPKRGRGSIHEAARPAPVDASAGAPDPASSPETVSAGAASELKDLFEKKMMAVRMEASPPPRRNSWRPASTGPAAAPPPQRRSLQELLKADEQRQRAE
mmetsp:Transcript_66109/g.196758  ORF Transcript_66109/g.196758 Transcript_66109/m.196758 type:complete len:215 (-) Transcript_66109:144-788(-)